MDGVDPEGTVDCSRQEATSPSSRPARSRSCPPSSPIVTSAIPTAPVMPPTLDGRNPRYRIAFQRPAEELINSLKGRGDLRALGSDRRYEELLGAPTSPEDDAVGDARYATFAKGAMYWSPEPARSRSPARLRRLGVTGLRTWSTRLPDQRGNTRAAADHAELPAWNLNFDRFTGIHRGARRITSPPLPTQAPGGPTVPPDTSRCQVTRSRTSDGPWCPSRPT